MEIEQRKSADLFTAISPKEIDQAVGGGNVRPDGMRASAPIMGEIASPTRRKRSRRMALPL
jgi:hypothetical protein